MVADANRLRDLGRLAQAVGGGVVLVEADGTVRLRTDSVLEMLGEHEDMEAAWERVLACILDALRDHPADESEITINVAINPETEPDGPVQPGLLVRALRVGDRGESGFLALVAKQSSIIALQSDLRLASQMRHLHTTYRQAAHDLRAPLNAIAINLELIRQDVIEAREADKRDAEKRVELLRREVTRLSRMLQVLLSQSGPPRFEPRVFGLRRLLREVLELVQPQARRLGVRMALSVPETRVAVLGARDHFKQAVVNLAVNALEAMPHGGALEIELLEEDEHAIVLLRDHGVGIPEQHLDKVFNLHFTTKPDGTGIGLFTTRAAIESMGGELTIQSRVDQGTTVRIELPAVAADIQQEVRCSTS